MRKVIIAVFAIVFFSCHQEKNRNIATHGNSDNDEVVEKLYHQCDTVIRLPDTLKIVNSKLDTTIIETGIFTYLQYDYPLTTPHKIIELSKMAVQYDKKGKKSNANEYYNEVIAFYQDERPEQLKQFSDMNDYLRYEVNSAILCSYAFEKIGNKGKAMKVLQPFLANVEASKSRIHEYYIQLCIDRYGVDSVREVLNNCAKTIQFKKQDAPEKDDWVISVFGADIGLGKSFETKNITIPQADTLVKRTDFYKLIQ